MVKNEDSGRLLRWIDQRMIDDAASGIRSECQGEP